MAFCTACRQTNPGAFCSYCGDKLAVLERNLGDGRARPIVILFSDLQNSSQYAQVHSLAESARALQQYHQILTDAVLQHGGQVAQIGGDDFLAYFDYEQPGNSADIRGVRAGLSALRAIKVANISGGLSLAVRIAVHRGEANVFQSASGEVQFGGPAANTAARLQAFAPSNGLLVSAPLGDRLGNAFALSECGPYELKGLSTQLSAYRVGAERSNKSDRNYPKALTAFTGRENELAKLRRITNSPKHEKAPIVVRGEPGIGKTRLVQEFVAGHDAKWLRVNCSEANRAAPYGAAIAVAGQLVQHIFDTRLEDKHWTKRVDEAVLQSPVMRLLGISAGDSIDSGDPEVSVTDMKTFLANLLANTSDGLCLWLDDAHWAEQASIESLRALQQSADRRFEYSIFTARLEYETASETLVDLTQLNASDCASLFSALGLNPNNDNLLASVLDKTAGNPLYIEQYVYSLIDQGLANTDSLHSPSELAMPRSLNEILVSRIDALERGISTLLRASTIGDRQLLRAHRAFSTFDDEDFELDLDHLTKRQLIEIDDDKLNFKHGLIRDAVYGSIPRQEAISLHRQFAGFLEKNPELGNAELIADHWQSGKEDVFAVLQYLNASSEHIERSLYRAGLDSLDKAERLLPSTSDSAWRTEKEYELLTLKGNALSVLEKYGSSARLELSKRTLALYQQANIGGTELLPLMYGRWTYYLARSDTRTIEWAKRITDVSQSGDARGIPNISVTVNFVNGVTAFVAGRLVKGIELLSAAYNAYSPSDHERYMQYYGEDHGLYSSVWLQWALVHRGDLDAAMKQCEESDRLAARFGDPLSEMLTLTYRQHVISDLKDVNGVIALSDHISQRSEECGLDYYRIIATGVGGRARLLTGDTSMKTQAERTVKTLGKNGTYLLRIMVHRDMVRVHQNNKDLASQYRELALCDETLGETFEGMYVSDVEHLKGYTAELSGNLELATSHYESSLNTARQQGAQYYEVQAAQSLARLAMDKNQIETARRIVDSIPELDLTYECFVFREMRELRAELGRLEQTREPDEAAS